MKVLLLAGALALISTLAHAQYYGHQGYGTGSNPNSHDVSGYTRSDGSYVQPYTATDPNRTQTDNYSTTGNYNPHNGTVGTRTPRY